MQDRTANRLLPPLPILQLNYNAVIMKIISLFMIFTLIACFYGNDTVTITVFNKLSVPIDSIVIPQKNFKFGENLKQGASEAVKVKLSPGDLKGEGAFDIHFYFGKKFFRRAWGFHDFH